MERLFSFTLVLATVVSPAFADAHKETYPMACSALWPAVKSTVRNSGFYGIVFLDNTEMIASFSIGTRGNGVLRVDSAVLNVISDSSCELQLEPLAKPIFANDAADFKKRLDSTLSGMKSSQASPSKGDAK